MASGTLLPLVRQAVESGLLGQITAAQAETPVSRPAPAFAQPQQQQAPIAFPEMQAGGGRFVANADGKMYNGQNFAKPAQVEEPWYKRLMNDPAAIAQLGIGFNSMRLNPDQGLAQVLNERVKTAGEMSARNMTAEKVSLALKNQGRFEEAALVESNPDMAKTVLSAMFTGDRAKSFTFASGSQLNTKMGTNVFDAKKPYKVASNGDILEIGGSGTNTNLNVNMGNTAGDSFIKRTDQLADTAMASGNILASTDTMMALLDEGVKTGFGQETMLSMQQGLQLFNPNYQTKDIAGKEAFLAESVRAILPQVKQLGVNPTDADLKFISSGSATLGKSVEGNKLMLKGIRLKAERDQFIGGWASNWEMSNVQLLSSNPIVARAKFNQDLIALQKTNPLFTQAGEMLRREFQSITATPTNPARGVLEQGGFVTQGSPQ
jgi:hypothetical protein